MNFRFIKTEYIESVTGGDRDMIRELAELFRSQVHEFVSEMKSLLEKKDYFSLGLLAHKAKSSVAIMGMEELASLLKKFEFEAKEGRAAENYSAYISKFESDTREAVGELDKYLAL